MRRTLLIGLAAIILCGLLGFGVRYWRNGSLLSLLRRDKPDIEKVGGTILVYEFNRAEPLDEQTMQASVEAVQGRLPWHATARAQGNKQIEILIPRYKDPVGEVEEVKRRLMITGTLEFRILANERDDRDVFEELQDFFDNAAKDGDEQKLLLKASKNGVPPLVPEPLDGKKDWKLEPHPKREQNRAAYAWVELGRQERWLLGLDNQSEFTKPDNDSEPEKKRFHLWQEGEKSREKGKPVVLHAYGSMLLYSRACENAKLSRDERETKKYEYFFLTRLPERDEDSGEELAVSGRDLTQVSNTLDPFTGGPQVAFNFNKRGADRLYRLTSQNTPGPEENRFPRHLAMILDGQIVSAPTIQSAIRDAGRITGEFTKVEVDALVAVLRAGALPVPLKPAPVQEITVPPKKK